MGIMNNMMDLMMKNEEMRGQFDEVLYEMRDSFIENICGRKVIVDYIDSLGGIESAEKEVRNIIETNIAGNMDQFYVAEGLKNLSFTERTMIKKFTPVMVKRALDLAIEKLKKIGVEYRPIKDELEA